MYKYAVLFLCVSWLLGILRHFWILPVIDDDLQVTGFEFRIKF